MGNASQGVGRFGSSAAGTVSALRSFTQQTNQIREGMNGVIGTAGGLVSAMGQLGSAIQTPAQGIGDMITRMVGLAGTGVAVGSAFGPGGAIVGGLIGAFTPAIIEGGRAVLGMTEQLENQSTVIEALVLDYDDLLQSIQRASREQNRSQRLSMGLGTDQEHQAEVTSLENRLATFSRAISDHYTEVARLRQRDDSVAEQQERLTAIERLNIQRVLIAGELENARTRRQISAAEQQISDMEDLQRLGEHHDARRSISNSARDEEAREIEADQRAALSRAEEYDQLVLSRRRAQLELEKDMAEQILEVRRTQQEEVWRIQEQDKARQERAFQQQSTQAQTLAEQAGAAATAFANQRGSDVASILEAYNTLNDANLAAGRDVVGFGKVVEKTFKGIVSDVVDVVAQNLVAGFQAMVTGAMTADEAMAKMAQGILQSITQLAIGEAIKNFAYALANLAEGIATDNPKKYAAAGAFAAAGAMWTVVGGVAGGVMAATSGGGAGAGGDVAGAGGTAGAGSAQNNQMDAPASDTGPKTVVVNYSGTVFATKDEMKRELKRIANS